MLQSFRMTRPPFPFELLTVLLPFAEEADDETALDRMTTDEAVVAEGHEGEDDFPFRMLLTFVVSEHFALDEDSSTRLSLSS